MTNVRPVTVPNPRSGYSDSMEYPAGTTGERFTPAPPEDLARIDGLVREVWGMRPAEADASSVPTDRYISFGLAGVGRWGLAYVRREGDRGGALVPAVTVQGPEAVSPELYVIMAEGTVWWQEGQGAVPADAGARGAQEMTSILETIRTGFLNDPRDCTVDGRPLVGFMTSAGH